MVANSFVVVGDTAVPDLQGMFTDMSTNGTSSDGMETADNVQIWTGTTYDTYFFGNFGGEYGEEYDNKWYNVNDDSEPTLDEVPIGNGAWFKNYSGTAKTLTLAGEVNAESVSVTIGPVWTMLGNPFPADLKLNGTVDWATCGATASDGMETADNIQVWTGTTYNTYFFGNFGGEYGEEYDNKWYNVNDDSEPTTDVIPSGNAAWYKNASGSSFTIVIPSPISE